MRPRTRARLPPPTRFVLAEGVFGVFLLEEVDEGFALGWVGRGEQFAGAR